MICGTHKLYNLTQDVMLHQVVEVENGVVVKIYPFECELHSMIWFDAIILSDSLYEKPFFNTMEEILEYSRSTSSVTSPCYAYGVTIDADGCMLVQLK